MMPLPHTVTIKRRDLNSAAERQFNLGETVVATAVRALISPASAVLEDGVLGPVPVSRDMVFIEPGVDVRGGDMLVDEDTGERWQVVSPPSVFRNPITWEADHIEVMVARADDFA